MLSRLPGVLPPPLHQGFINAEKPVAKPVPLPSLSRETGSISWDYMQHLKENIYRIYIHIPFALLSGGSPCPPSLPAALTPSPPRLLPLAFPPCCHNARLCERNNVYSPRGWGIGNEKGCAPRPGPGLRSAAEKEEFLQECRWPARRQPRRGDKYSCWRREGGKKEKEGPGDRSNPGSIIFLCGLRVCWKFPLPPLSLQVRDAERVQLCLGLKQEMKGMSGSGRAVQQPQERRRGSGARRRGLWEPACGCNYGDACEDGALEHWKCIALPPRPSLPLAAFPRQKPRFLLLLLAGKPSSWNRGALELPCSCGWVTGMGTPAGAPQGGVASL